MALYEHISHEEYLLFTLRTSVPSSLSASTDVDGMQWTSQTKPVQARKKLCAPQACPHKRAQCGAHSLLPTTAHFQFRCGQGPPGTQGVIAMTIPTPVASEVAVPPHTWDLYQVSSFCFHFVMVPSGKLTSVLTVLPQSQNSTFYFSLIYTVIFPQNVFSSSYHHGSNQLVLWVALPGKSADHASALWISFLLL